MGDKPKEFTITGCGTSVTSTTMYSVPLDEVEKLRALKRQVKSCCQVSIDMGEWVEIPIEFWKKVEIILMELEQ